jgi:hypothetical protein
MVMETAATGFQVTRPTEASFTVSTPKRATAGASKQPRGSVPKLAHVGQQYWIRSIWRRNSATRSSFWRRSQLEAVRASRGRAVRKPVVASARSGPRRAGQAAPGPRRGQERSPEAARSGPAASRAGATRRRRGLRARRSRSRSPSHATGYDGGRAAVRSVNEVAVCCFEWISTLCSPWPGMFNWSIPGGPGPVEQVWVGVVLLNHALQAVDHGECLVVVGDRGESGHGRSSYETLSPVRTAA